MQGIHNYISDTNHVSRVYGVATVLHLHFLPHVTLFLMLNVFMLLNYYFSNYYYYYYYYYFHHHHHHPYCLYAGYLQLYT